MHELQERAVEAHAGWARQKWDEALSAADRDELTGPNTSLD